MHDYNPIMCSAVTLDLNTHILSVVRSFFSLTLGRVHRARIYIVDVRNNRGGRASIVVAPRRPGAPTPRAPVTHNAIFSSRDLSWCLRSFITANEANRGRGRDKMMTFAPTKTSSTRFGFTLTLGDLFASLIPSVVDYF